MGEGRDERGAVGERAEGLGGVVVGWGEGEGEGVERGRAGQFRRRAGIFTREAGKSTRMARKITRGLINLRGRGW